MSLSCLCGSLGDTLCGNTDIDGLITAGSETKRLAEETVELSNNTQEKGQKVIDFCRDVQDTLSNIGTNPKSFVQIMGLKDQMQETVAEAAEIDDMAQQCVDKSNQMKAAMERGVESLPPSSKEAIREDEETDDEMDKHLLDVDEDIQELEQCTESLKNMNFFTASQSGTRAFSGLVTKGEVCRTMFEQVKNFAASIARITQVFVQQNCCANFQAFVGEASDMIKCIRLSSLISAIATAAKRLIQAMINLIKVAWEKFARLLDEFPAAKKIENFVNGINPLNKVKTGELYKKSQLLKNRPRRMLGSVFRRSGS
jgi:ferritin-like metal-binding protein YciE